MNRTEKKKVLITTAIDYANATIHIGHAYEKILADCIARYFKLKLGNENVFLLTGTDEHGTTNFKAAEKEGLNVEGHVANISKQDQEQLDSLNVNYDRFIRTTDRDHEETASNFLQRAFDNGDVYKDKYEGLYCEGCESYKTLSELNDDGQCPLHTTRQIQKIEEENYFFKWSRYSDFLKELVKSEKFVLPETKKNEMLSFVEQGLKDIPISRPKFKLSWGIDVPFDKDHVIYVWFDALINYYTYGSKNNLWNEDSYIVHFVGKDIARWHVLLWPAMLKSANLRIPDSICIHGFINLDGEKISKSKGNVIRPTELVNKYGTDAVRYYFLKFGPIIEDVDISINHFEEVFNADLANGIGNAVARVSKLAEKSGFEFSLETDDKDLFSQKWAEPLINFRVDLALQNIWKKIADLDKHINDNEPWSIDDKDKLFDVLSYEVNEIREIGKMIEPFMPSTSNKILKQFGNEKIFSVDHLFSRLK